MKIGIFSTTDSTKMISKLIYNYYIYIFLQFYHKYNCFFGILHIIIIPNYKDKLLLYTIKFNMLMNFIYL